MTGKVLKVNTEPTASAGPDPVLEKENDSAALLDKTNSSKSVGVGAASFDKIPTPTSKTDLDKRLKEETRRRVSALRAYQGKYGL